jgi:hypothetical protein
LYFLPLPQGRLAFGFVRGLLSYAGIIRKGDNPVSIIIGGEVFSGWSWGS